MTENYGIEGWNSPSIFFSFSCRINNGELGEEEIFSVLIVTDKDPIPVYQIILKPVRIWQH